MNVRVPRWGVVLVLVTAAFLAAMTGSASAADFNNPCIACHATATQWQHQATVDRDTVCNKCHTQGLLGSHPYHQGGNCGAVCHPGWGDSLQSATPTWRGVQGSFASASSANAPASVIHVIHSNARWMSKIETADSKCASCHSIAACSACHEDQPTTMHSNHASVLTQPWTGTTGSGITGEDQTIDSSVSETNRCGSAQCHNISGLQSRTPVEREDDEESVTLSALQWSTKYGANYSGSAITGSNRVNATMTTTFTGQQIEIITDRDPYRGYMAVSIDNGPETLVNLYAASTTFQQVTYRSPVLTSGTHTIKVRVTGTKDAAARATYVWVDAFRFYSTMPASIAPACISCHAATCSGTGGGFTHDASLTVGVYEGYACTQCHTLRLKDEHNRTSSNTAATGCSACHPTYADYSYDDYDLTCGSTGDAGRPGCHQGAQAEHIDATADHTVTGNAVTSDCILCHSGDLGVIHNDSNASRPQHSSLSGGGSNGQAYTTNCLTCHSTTKLATAKNCDAAGCHVASGVVSMATHPAVPHDANPALGEAMNTAGKPCATCHAVNGATGAIDAIADHAKSSARTTADQPIGCGSCHGVAYYPTDWLGENDTCVACHPSDGSKAGAPHEDAEYASKHDFSAVGTNAASCGTGAFCHPTAQVDLMHDAGVVGAGCEDCHTAAVRQSGVPTVRACSGCHATNHDLTKHVTTASAECVSCHGATDVRDVHTDCATCHANPSYPGLTSVALSTECMDCHAPDGALASQAYSPIYPAHSTGADVAHTATPFTAAYQGVGVDGTVNAEGKECSVCHSTTLRTAHATTSTSGGTVTCVECHENTTLGAATQVATNWPSKKCAVCHDTGASTTHADYTTIHSVTAGTCAGTGSGCHNYTDLAKLHDKNQAGGPVKYQSCSNTDAGDPTGCHATDDVRPTRWSSNAASCGEGTTGCHTDKNVSNHGKKHALTIASSVYADASGEGVAAGCLSSGGGGCHDGLGSANTSTDIAAYHQTTDCETSLCHVSANKTTHLQPYSCQECHDGTYQYGVDAVALADSAPAGHYPVAAHTATGGLGTVTVGGTAGETCSVCHDLGLMAAHTGIAATTKGTKVTCGECHSYNVSVASQIKVGNWTTDSCIDCHQASVIPGAVMHGSGSLAYPVPATGSAGCASSGNNCHASNDLHALHKDDPGGCDLAGCHDAAHKNVKPTATSCGATGACHTTGFNTNMTFPTHTPDDEPVHAPTDTTQANASWALAGATCNACHIVSLADGGLRGEHAISTSIMSVVPGNVCRNCHNSTASDSAIAGGTWTTNRNTVNACAQCHTVGNGIGVHTTENAAAHTDVTSPSCGNTGAGCHPTNNLAAVGTPTTTANIHANCLRCHDRAGSATVPAPGGGNMRWNASLDTCGQGGECHNIGTQYPTAGEPIHRNGLADAATGNDTDHHTGAAATKATYPETAAGVYSDNIVCTACHSNTLKAAHATLSTNGGSVTCAECHNGSGLISSATAAGQVKGDWTANKCTDCHTPASTHTAFESTLGYSANHASTSAAGCATSGAGCHTNAPRATTAVAPAGEMAQLHPTAGCSASSGTSGTSCHALNKPVASIAKTCGTGNNCHSSYTATAGHSAGAVTGNDAAQHMATSGMTDNLDAAYVNNDTCNVCHSATMTTAHSTRQGWTGSYCADCHNATSPVNSVAVIKKATPWATRTCAECHTTKHAAYGNHVATMGTVGTADSCNDAQCHGTLDVRTLHDKVTGTGAAGCSTTDARADGTTNPACHELNKDVSTVPMSCGAGSGGGTGCHQNRNDANHGADHDSNKAAGTPAGTSGQNYTYGSNVGCFGCHYSDLREEHAPAGFTGGPSGVGAGRTMEGGAGGTDGCGVCHSDKGTPGTFSTGTAVTTAITNNDLRCISCHNNGTATDNVAGKTLASPHKVTGAGHSDPAVEFVDGATRGGHNSMGQVWFPNTTGFGTVNTVANPSWPLPPSAEWLNAGWTTTSIVLCSDCHSYTGATGPQGATAKMMIDPAYSQTQYRSPTASNWSATGTNRVICAKCHNLTGMAAGTAAGHKNHAGRTLGSGGACIDCHILIPHAWKRPRLLPRTVGTAIGGVSPDTVPYVEASRAGLTAIKVTTDMTPGTWSGANCTTGGCKNHGTNTPYWP